MDELTLDEAMEELESAEDFLNYFGVDFDPAVVHVNRLHILQRYHDYLGRESLPQDEAAQREVYKTLLTRAYQDFVQSDALTEKVFKVFRMHEPQVAFVPLTSIGIMKHEPAEAHEGCGCGGRCNSSQAALEA